MMFPNSVGVAREHTVEPSKHTVPTAMCRHSTVASVTRRRADKPAGIWLYQQNFVEKKKASRRDRTVYLLLTKQLLYQ